MKRILLFFILTITSLIAYAQLNENINRHIIIAVDEYPLSTYSAVSTSKIVSVIKSELEELSLGESDYFSCVKFGIGTQDSSLDNYAQAVGNFTWKSKSEFESEIDSLVKDVRKYHNHRGGTFSMLTGAKFYSLNALYPFSGENSANRTYMLMITDNQYNGNGDMNSEFNHFKGLDSNFNKNLKREDFLDKCISISEQYRFDYISEKVIETGWAPYKAILFEIVPSSSFSLNSAVNFPANLGLKRVKGGYKLDFEYDLVDEGYTLKKLKVDIIKNDNTVESVEYYSNNERVEIGVKSTEISGDSIQVEIRGWLQKNDEIYNSVVMNPYDDKHFSRLTYRQKLPKSGETKILNIIPLSDMFWWFFTEDLEKAVIVWDVIIILIIIAMVIVIGFLIFKKITKYVPDNDSIKINNI